MEDNSIITHSTFDEGDDFFITDKWQQKHHFKILSFEVPSGLFSEAIEVLNSESDTEPRIFHLLSDFDADVEMAEFKLKEKIKKGLNKRYLDVKDGNYSIGKDGELAGSILYDDKVRDSVFDYFFQVDGKRITIEKFIDLLEGFEGWNFKFQILDTTDDLD